MWQYTLLGQFELSNCFAHIDINNLEEEVKMIAPNEDRTEKEANKDDYQHLKFQCRPRWGRDMDRKLFKTLRDMEKTGEISLEELVMLDPKYEAPYHEGIQRV